MSSGQNVVLADQGTTAEEASTAGSEEDGHLPGELASAGGGTINNTDIYKKALIKAVAFWQIQFW